jgi:hypothetical protein
MLFITLLFIFIFATQAQAYSILNIPSKIRDIDLTSSQFSYDKTKGIIVGLSRSDDDSVWIVIGEDYVERYGPSKAEETILATGWYIWEDIYISYTLNSFYTLESFIYRLDYNIEEIPLDQYVISWESNPYFIESFIAGFYKRRPYTKISKDEFETTAQYNTRLIKTKKDNNTIANKYFKSFEDREWIYKGIPVNLGRYDADNQTFRLEYSFRPIITNEDPMETSYMLWNIDEHEPIFKLYKNDISNLSTGTENNKGIITLDCIVPSSEARVFKDLSVSNNLTMSLRFGVEQHDGNLIINILQLQLITKESEVIYEWK